MFVEKFVALKSDSTKLNQGGSFHFFLFISLLQNEHLIIFCVRENKSLKRDAEFKIKKNWRGSIRNESMHCPMQKKTS